MEPVQGISPRGVLSVGGVLVSIGMYPRQRLSVREHLWRCRYEVERSPGGVGGSQSHQVARLCNGIGAERMGAVASNPGSVMRSAEGRDPVCRSLCGRDAYGCRGGLRSGMAAVSLCRFIQVHCDTSC
jgi:hypothetical protein